MYGKRTVSNIVIKLVALFKRFEGYEVTFEVAFDILQYVNIIFPLLKKVEQNIYFTLFITF